MDRESVDRLRFDRRLERRRGWVENADKQAYLEALPDVSEKMTRGLDEPEDSNEPGAAHETPAADFGQHTDMPSTPTPTPTVPSSTSSTGDSDPSGTFSGGGTELS